MLRRFLRLDAQTVTCLNVLFLLNIHSSMTFDELFDELWNTNYFISQKHLGNDLRMPVEEGFVVQKLEVYYITEQGGKVLNNYPHWKLNQRRKRQVRPVIF